MAAGNFFGGQFFGGGFFGTIAAATTQNAGGYLREPGAPSAEDRRIRRIQLGILPPEAMQAIEEVAARQVERLEQDHQKQFEELTRELELRRIEWDARYLEALATHRERLIDAEIAQQFTLRRQMVLRRNQNDIILLALVAAASAI